MRYTITCRSSFNAELERQSLIAGLHAPNAAISPKYFYDELGCLLYLAICRLPEYYLTRTEASIFKYARHEFEAFLQQAGFATIQFWQDDSRDFCVFHAS